MRTDKLIFLEFSLHSSVVVFLFSIVLISDSWRLIVGTVYIIYSIYLFLKYYILTDFVLNPIGIWMIFWILPIGIAVLPIKDPIFFGKLSNWDILTKIGLYVSIVVSIGLLLIYHVIIAKKFGELRKKLQCKPINYKLMEFVSNLLALIGIASASVYYIVYGIPLFSATPDISRITFSRTFYFNLLTLSVYSFFLNGIISSYKKISPLEKTCMVLLLFLILLSGWRGLFVYSIIFYITPISILKGLNLRSSFILLLLFIIIFVTVGWARSKSGDILYYFLLVYYYIAPNFYNFNEVILHEKRILYGLETFNGIAKLLLKPIGKYQPIKLSVEFGTFNVMPGISYAYIDFRFMGIALYITLLFLLGLYLYIKLTKSTKIDIKDLFIYSSYVQAVFKLHNGSYFSSASFFYWLLLTFFLQKILMKGSKDSH